MTTTCERQEELSITFVVLDSLMAFTGGDASAEAAGRLFAALRQLNVTCLSLGHVPKQKAEGQEEHTVYGSVFNSNYARSVWELKCEQETSADSAVLGLFHRKSNLSRKHAPLGLRVTHNAEGTYVRYESYNLSATTELLNALPLPARIRNLLDSDGIPRSSKTISEELGVKQATVQATLSRYKGHKWGRIGENHEAKWTTMNS